MVLWFLDITAFTVERIRQHILLVIWVLLGLIVAATLSLSLSLYVDAVYTDLLTSRLDTPPYAFRYRYLGAWNGNIGQQDVERANLAATDYFVATIGLPVERAVTYIRGGTWTARQDNLNLGAFGLGTLKGADDQIWISAGEWSDDMPLDDDTVAVLLPEGMFYRLGIEIGDTFTAQRSGGEAVTFRVAAFWRSINTNDPSWIFVPRFFDEVMLVQEPDFWRLLADFEYPVDEAAWFTVFDGSDVRTSDVDALLGKMVDAGRTLEAALPGIREDLTPRAGLTAFNKEVNDLTQQLFIIIAPVGGLVLYFVSLVAGLLVTRQQPEDVKLRSRGMSRGAVLFVHMLMWLMLALSALGVALVLSPIVVELVGQTASFLQFDDVSSVPDVVITQQALSIGLSTVLISASSGLFLAWRTTQQNINTLRQARYGKAWWQRAYLDVLLLIPALYVLYTLQREGGFKTQAGQSAFSDPLVFIGPTVFALAFALLFLRLLPMLLTWMSWLVSLTTDIPLLMALREMTRSIGRYRGALLMMAFTLSLTGFTASMASTLDQSLEDTIHYSIGADLVLMTAVDAQTEDSQDASGQVTQTVTGYNVPPIEALYDVEGIAYVSRFGRYPARLTVGNQRLEGRVIGVDRVSLPAIAYFRDDFADQPLADLLNQLAGERTGIIISRQTAEAYNLIVGQEVTFGVQALNTWFDTRVPIVAVVDYFPTLDPNAGFFAITNLDPIFELVGTQLPHDYWLRLAPGYDVATVKAHIDEIAFPVVRWLEPQQALQAARAEPARRGVLGFLSVGFVASILLTLIAAIIQSVASFRAQASQLGALRAMGLGSVSIAIYVLILQGMMAISGILSGTSIGVTTTILFLPLLDFSGGLPPYLVRVAWDEIVVVYSLFAAVLFTVTMLTALFLSRQQLSHIVRLGDASA
ncbi:MAG: hypothetical protein D6711_16835 [Chloroflexi bacterium]|nr:MAG: hypothetical protein D6711_16835 [Chloroflexota bacterium]